MLRVLQQECEAKAFSKWTSILTRQGRAQRSLNLNSSCQQRRHLSLLHRRSELCVPAISGIPHNIVRPFTLTTVTQNVILVDIGDLVSVLSKTLYPEHIEMLPPKPNHSIIDRPQEMKKLKDALTEQSSEKVAIVYVSGEPGVGKSQLVRQYAETNYPYYNTVTPESRTILTLDMADFSDGYRKLATRLEISKDLSYGQDLGKIAEEMKKALSMRTSWLLIIDNHNSTDCEGFDEDYVGRKLLPLQQPSEWGMGNVLVTTSNAVVIPNTPATSMVTIDPLTLEESAEVIGELAGYKLSENERMFLKYTAERRGWRHLPLIMAHIGDHMRLHRTQKEGYDLIQYIKEVDKGDAEDPEELNCRDVQLALQNIMKGSEAVRKAFLLLTMCPEGTGIPQIVLQRLMKVYHKQQWAHEFKELEKCTVLTLENEDKNDLKFFKAHKVYLRMMQNITGNSSIDSYTTGEEDLIAKFVNCLITEFDEMYSKQAKLHSLLQLFEEFSAKERAKFSKELKVEVDHALSTLQQKAVPLRKLLKQNFHEKRV